MLWSSTLMDGTGYDWRESPTSIDWSTLGSSHEIF